MADPVVTINESAGTMTIVMPIAAKPAPSKSGKTKVLATTHGNMKTGVKYKGKHEITIGVNAYFKEE